MITYAQLKSKYQAQKNRAKIRGIEWKLTFDEWVEWWGNDINKRGKGADQLQMQRHLDSGAYEIGNISKGHPKNNKKQLAI